MTSPSGASASPGSSASSGATVRPLHHRWWTYLVVALGGALGTLARHGVGLALPTTGHTPWATLLGNLTGAFLLGLLLESLARTPVHPSGSAAAHSRRHALRLLLGTGVMGGYTTYSSFSVQTLTLLQQGLPGTALTYVLLSLLGGLLAAAAGITVARGLVRPAPPGEAGDAHDVASGESGGAGQSQDAGGRR